MALTTTLKVLREAIADQLGLLIRTSISVDADPVFTVPSLSDKTPDAEKMRDSYLYQSGELRRILTYGYPTNDQVTVTRATAITVGAAEIYFMLDPDELNTAINEALQELYFIDRATLTLLANTYTYVLPTWIQQRGQVLGAKWRDITLLTSIPSEEEVSSYRIIEQTNVCTLFINQALRDITTFDVQVSARRMYGTLATDSATTTCPYPLIFAVATVKVLHKLFNKYGKGITSLFGQKMVVAEGEMAKNKMDWLPKLTAREYIEEEAWQGIDGNANFDYPNW